MKLILVQLILSYLVSFLPAGCDAASSNFVNDVNLPPIRDDVNAVVVGGRRLGKREKMGGKKRPMRMMMIKMEKMDMMTRSCRGEMKQCKSTRYCCDGLICNANRKCQKPVPLDAGGNAFGGLGGNDGKGHNKPPSACSDRHGICNSKDDCCNTLVCHLGKCSQCRGFSAQCIEGQCCDGLLCNAGQCVKDLSSKP